MINTIRWKLEIHVNDAQSPDIIDCEAMGMNVDTQGMSRCQRVTRPAFPMVAMKAKASGTPAKLEATPLNDEQESSHRSRKPTQDDRISQQESRKMLHQGR